VERQGVVGRLLKAAQPVEAGTASRRRCTVAAWRSSRRGRRVCHVCARERPSERGRGLEPASASGPGNTSGVMETKNLPCHHIALQSIHD
jgi:hypothetical protein